MPKGFDLSKGPSQKNLRQKTHKKCKKRQGASTFQKVRTKKPSAKNGNNHKNAKGLRPFKGSEAKITKEASKDGCQKGGRRFFHPNHRHTSFNLPSNEKNKTLRRQQRTRKGGDVFSQNTKFPRVASLANKSSIGIPNTSSS